MKQLASWFVGIKLSFKEYYLNHFAEVDFWVEPYWNSLAFHPSRFSHGCLVDIFEDGPPSTPQDQGLWCYCVPVDGRNPAKTHLGWC